MYEKNYAMRLPKQKKSDNIKDKINLLNKEALA